MSFNYHLMPKKKGSNIRTPTIPVMLKGQSNFSMDVMALIDSGADMSVIPEGLAKVLNLDLSKPTQSSFGIGSEIKVKPSKMEITIKKNRENYKFVIPVEVILNDDAPIILGRKGFFDEFVITIDERNKKIKLKKRTELFR
jgi:predicted aspartyl protease